MFRLMYFAFFYFVVTSAGKVEFQNCGSLGEVVSVSFQNCDELPCELREGQYYETEILFQPRSPSSSLTTVLSWKSANSEPILERNGCEGLSTGCPYNGGLLNNYKLTFTLPDEMFEPQPLKPVGNLEYKLKNSSGSVEVCISFPAILTQ